MDPMTIAALAQVGGGLAAKLLGGGDARRKRQMQQAAIDELMRTNAEAGDASILHDPNDAALSGRQMETIGALQNIYQQGGMDPQARAALEQANATSAAQEQGTRGALTQNFQARGAGGAGSELAAQLANQQGAANRSRMAGTQAAGDARTRAINAAMGAGSLSGQARGQGLQRANSVDAVNEFNASQRLRKAGALSNAYTGAAVQAGADADRSQFDMGNLAEVAGRFGKDKGWW